MIGAGQVWPIVSAWVDGIAAGLEKNSPPRHDMIDRRVIHRADHLDVVEMGEVAEVSPGGANQRPLA